jgi:uncharacterized protein YecE (DUF72 family)
MQEAPPEFYSGISGIALPVPKSQYPEEFQNKSRLEYYASLFNSVEVNSIFYKLPRNSTVINWRESVPDNFCFTFKVSKTITHVKKLNFKKEDINAFVATVDNIGDKKGCLLAQFPPSLKVDNLNELQTLAEALCEATADEWRITMEFRSASWYEREVYEVLNEYNITMVLQDIPASATPPSDTPGSFVYLRFHGPEPRYRGSYSNHHLKEKAELIKTLMKEGKTVYAYFNNTMGNAVNNLQTLNDYVSRSK